MFPVVKHVYFYKRIEISKTFPMPIKSYLAHPQEGKKEQMIADLSALQNVEIVPGENKEVVIVITDTVTDKEEEQLKEKLDGVESMKLLAMVSGFNTPKA